MYQLYADFVKNCMRSGTIERAGREGFTQTCRFEIGPPGSAEGVLAVEGQLNQVLPIAYKQFIIVNDGALLYYDAAYGQWGVRLHGTQPLVYGNSEHTSVCDLPTLQLRYPGASENGWLLFGSWVGDLDLLAFKKTDLPSGGIKSDPKVWVIADLDFEEAVRVSDDFATWLSQLMALQGEKWWEGSVL